MDEDLKKLMEENLELSRENNFLLKKIRGSQKRAAMMRLMYWLLIVATTFGAYYYIQPYLTQLMSVYSGAQENVDTFQSYFPESKSFKSFIDQFKGNEEIPAE